MIELTNVSKHYSVKGIRKVIFDNISFRFPKNCNIAIMGPNGAGKSTLMRLIAGTEHPDKGRICRSVRVSWPLGFSGGFNGSMTGIENILFVARIYGENPKDILDYVQEFSELGSSIKLPIKTYSSGMKARLAFGLSMAINFDCYLVDEVTAVGDENFKRKSKKAFNEKSEKSNIIMISHSIETIKSYCNCGILINQNSLVFYDKIDDLISSYKKILL